MAVQEQEEFDYIFAGAGMAAASLLLRIIRQPELAGKKILIADPHAFAGPEKTWCFWEKGEGFFEALVEKTWDKAWFHGRDFSEELQLPPYRYKMIRRKRVFDAVMSALEKRPDIRIVNSPITSFEVSGNKIKVRCAGGQEFRGGLVFNSIPEEQEKKPGHFYLLQHFRGWFIRTGEDIFNPESATLMDFRIDQENDCRCVYVLPFNAREALVEYTVFSEECLSDARYDEELAAYLSGIAGNGYEILEKETGVIPMYSAPFSSSRIRGLIHIGTRGGMTKASTGYTFQKAQKQSEALIKDLLAGKIPDEKSMKISSRFAWFDRVLLRILGDRILPGRDIFQDLFQKNPVQRVFRFLDEESGTGDEWKIMRSVPTIRFMLAGLKEILRRN
jgi:lycopene beta-cyclase